MEVSGKLWDPFNKKATNVELTTQYNSGVQKGTRNTIYITIYLLELFVESKVGIE